MTAWKGIVGEGFSVDDFADYARDIVLDAWKPEFIVLHNTQNPTLAEWHDVPGERRMQGLQSYYRDEQKWSGGPHLFVADDLIWVFTPLIVPGVHSPSWNHLAWGVELVGDYDHEDFTDPLRANAVAALVALHRLASWTDVRIRLHKEDPATTHKFCPGVNVSKADILADVQSAIA